QPAATHPDLHSFPTRRSSDLGQVAGKDYSRADRSAGRPATISNAQTGETARVRTITNKGGNEIVRRIVSNVRRLRLLHGRDQSAGGDQEGRRARARCEI